MVDRVILQKDEKDAIRQIESFTAVIQELVDKGGSIVQELLRAAMVNPLMGILVSLVLTDMLEKGKVIYPETALMFKALVVSSSAADIGSTLLEAIGKIFALPFSPVANAQPDIFKPSAQVIVFGDSSPKALEALLAKLPK
mgnify:CR=1 FL=1